jgi:ribosome biogenesis GTPase
LCAEIRSILIKKAERLAGRKLSQAEWLEGLVVGTQSGFFTVQTGHGAIVCQVRGKLKQEKLNTDPVALGDHVTISMQEDGSGMIEEVAERRRAFTRQMPPPGGRGAELIDREQVIIANPDQVVFVFACADPIPSYRMLDRMLVIAEKEAIPPIVVANKIDLVGWRDAKTLFGIYGQIGYPVIYTSATQKIGIRKLRRALRGKISAFTGPSGAGKSSLLNAIQPGLGLAVRTVSDATGKGRHTTVSSMLVPVDGGGYVADTPGIRAIALYDVEFAELDGYFVDIRPYVGQCQFSDCTHVQEPGCAVIAAVKRGKLDPERYESYLRLWEEIDDLYY